MSKKIGLPIKEADSLNLSEKLRLALKVDPNTRAYEVLTQIAALIGIDLGARVIEVMVFNERAELRGPIVICACDDLPRKVRMTLPTASIKGAKASSVELGTRGFRVINANASSGIRLKPPTLGRDSQNEVKHKRAGINPGSPASVCDLNTSRVEDAEVSATPKAIIKEVALNRWTNYARAKDVTEFDATEETDVIFRRDVETISEER